MDVSSAMSVVQTLFSALQCSQLKAISSSSRYKAKLDQLRTTVERIQAVLEDAEAKRELCQQERVYIEELKEAVYEADDLFDEFVTLVEHKKLTKRIKDRLFSLFTKFRVAFRMSHKVDSIKKKLDDIADNRKFRLKIDTKPTKNGSRETCSYEKDVIIGRERDLETIKGILLESNVERDVSFLSIVGIGGLGKTAITRQLFNNPSVGSAFPLKLWACVADQDQNHFEVKDILGKILDSAHITQHHGATMEWMQHQLEEMLRGQKYLLVLDDVWTEKRQQWLELIGCFTRGGRGSWIVVTTRSKNTAKMIGEERMHLLQGLSREHSLCLFKRMAFGSEQSNPPEYQVQIGEEIVKRCAHVPLAIRVVGSLLYSQDEHEWRSFQKFGMEKIRENENSIMPILKISYYQLESSIKSCFSYCALFPKDQRIGYWELITLWMAQGYITSNGGKSMEDVAEDYVKLLIQRCFFQDVRVEQHTRNIDSFKIHDLIHDVAQEVAGKEIRTVHSINGDVGKKVRHLSFIRSKSANLSFTKRTQVRSYLDVSPYWSESGLVMDKICVASLFANWKYLRALDLSRFGIENLPDSIDKLLHLRYLDLSENKFRVLPKTITTLYNLQTLYLTRCRELKQLPKDIGNLVQLRVLDLTGCYGLTCMPRGIGMLTCLWELQLFVLGGERCSSWNELLDGLDDLKSLRNLRGDLRIKFQFKKGTNVYEKGKDNGNEGIEGYLSDKEHLKFVKLTFSGEEGEDRSKYDEAVMNKLQPHHNLKELCLEKYFGASLVGWAREENLATSLPNLVEVRIENCPELRDLRCLGNLCHLKSLCVLALPNLEYIIDKNKTGGSNDMKAEAMVAGMSSSKTEGSSFFPSLKELYLYYLPKLKGWLRYTDELHVKCNSTLPLVFSQLKTFEITGCPQLTAFIQFPQLQHLILQRFNERLKIQFTRMINEELKEDNTEETSICPLFTTSSSSPWENGNMWSLGTKTTIDNMAWLHQSLPMEAFRCLQSLEICGDGNLRNLREVAEMFRTCSTSLRYLGFLHCPNLKSVLEGLDTLSSLERLTVRNCPNLNLSEGIGREAGSDMPLQSVHHSLRVLKLQDLPQLVNLPDWIQCLTTLQFLEIGNCKKLKSLPSWMSKLTSIVELQIWDCSPSLEERCKCSTGADWPHIQHIPSITCEVALDLNHIPCSS